MREKILAWAAGCRGRIPLPALGVLAAGCLLLLIPSGAPQVEQVPVVSGEKFELEQFERRLEEVLSHIEGAGETEVVLSLDSGSRQILAQDRQQSSAGSSLETVTIGGSSDRAVVPVQILAPEFRGALIVCRGAGDPQVRLAVTQAVCVLTGLGTDCVCVTAGM